MTTPTEAQTQFREAIRLERADRVAEAETAYTRLLERWPNHPDSWYNLAVLQRRGGRFEAALASYEQALACGISRPEEVHLNRGVIYSDCLRRDDDALRELRAALALNPAYAPALFNLANLMATVYADGGYGYAATSDISAAGLRDALERAAAWARATARHALFDSRTLPRPAARGEYASPALEGNTRSRREWFELLMEESRNAGRDARIVDCEAHMEVRHAEHRLVTSEGGHLVQRYCFLLPSMSVTAHADGDTQTRTLHGHRGICQQGGLEILPRFGFEGGMRRIAEEALELLAAPNCPTGTLDVLLMPDQMILQIHESIGHPLELDRILGDERNFAGTSFVTPKMFGSYRYGSDLLNVTFDPTRAEELGSYGWDDEGTKAEKVHLIRNGMDPDALLPVVVHIDMRRDLCPRVELHQAGPAEGNIQCGKHLLHVRATRKVRCRTHRTGPPVVEGIAPPRDQGQRRIPRSSLRMRTPVGRGKLRDLCTQAHRVEPERELDEWRGEPHVRILLLRHLRHPSSRSRSSAARRGGCPDSPRRGQPGRSQGRPHARGWVCAVGLRTRSR